MVLDGDNPFFLSSNHQYTTARERFPKSNGCRLCHNRQLLPPNSRASLCSIMDSREGTGTHLSRWRYHAGSTGFTSVCAPAYMMPLGEAPAEISPDELVGKRRLRSSVGDSESFANMLRLLQFIEHGNGVVLRGDSAIALFVPNKLVLPDPVVPRPLPRGN